MFTRRIKFYQMLGILITLTVSLVACQVINPDINNSPPTQDVGEEPPRFISTPAVVTSNPTPALTQSEGTDTATWLLGPTPYPTPSGKIIAWDELIDQNLIAGIKWDIYQGELRGNDDDEKWLVSFEHPTGWYIGLKSGSMQVFVQDIPVTQDSAQTEFAKFEIVRLSDPPMIEDGHALDPHELITVKMAGEPAIMHSITQQMDQRRQIRAIVQHGTGWLVATGDIVLPLADETVMDKYSVIIYTILSSIRFDHQGNATLRSTVTPVSATQRKPADSEFPAAGICDASQDNPVVIKISAGNMPDPRCIKVVPDQRLEFKNETADDVHIQLGRFDVSIHAGEIMAFDALCGDFLEPGVHHVTLSQGSAPEIWLVAK